MKTTTRDVTRIRLRFKHYALLTIVGTVFFTQLVYFASKLF